MGRWGIIPNPSQEVNVGELNAIKYEVEKPIVKTDRPTIGVDIGIKELAVGLTNTGCTAQLTIPSAVKASGNFFLII